jgi:hypothetical protein
MNRPLWVGGGTTAGGRGVTSAIYGSEWSSEVEGTEDIDDDASYTVTGGSGLEPCHRCRDESPWARQQPEHQAHESANITLRQCDDRHRGGRCTPQRARSLEQHHLRSIHQRLREASERRYHILRSGGTRPTCGCQHGSPSNQHRARRSAGKSVGWCGLSCVYV